MGVKESQKRWKFVKKKAGDEVVEEQGKEMMRYNIEVKTYNTFMEKINEIEYL